MSPQGADHWARIAAFGWYARRLHNLVIQKYMANPDKDTYNGIRDLLETALSELRGLDGEGDCRPPFCEDDMGNCVPCEENGHTLPT